MSLIAKHAAQFKEYLAKDHEVTLLNFTSVQGSQLSSLLQCVYNCLMAWAEHNNRENKNIAISAMDAFFEQVRAAELAPQTSDTCTTVVVTDYNALSY